MGVLIDKEVEKEIQDIIRRVKLVENTISSYKKEYKDDIAFVQQKLVQIKNQIKETVTKEPRSHTLPLFLKQGNDVKNEQRWRHPIKQKKKTGNDKIKRIERRIIRVKSQTFPRVKIMVWCVKEIPCNHVIII